MASVSAIKIQYKIPHKDTYSSTNIPSNTSINYLLLHPALLLVPNKHDLLLLLVGHLVGLLTSFKQELSANSSSFKAHYMLVDGVTEGLCEDIELLDALVDSFMPCRSFLHCPLVSVGDNAVGSASGPVSFVAFVSNNHLSRSQLAFHLVPVDANIRPATTHIGSIDPDNVSSLDAHSNLVSNTG